MTYQETILILKVLKTTGVEAPRCLWKTPNPIIEELERKLLRRSLKSGVKVVHAKIEANMAFLAKLMGAFRKSLSQALGTTR